MLAIQVKAKQQDIEKNVQNYRQGSRAQRKTAKQIYNK